MTNNEKFNALLNSCANPRRTYDALMALAVPAPKTECAAQETTRARLSELSSKLETV